MNGLRLSHAAIPTHSSSRGQSRSTQSISRLRRPPPRQHKRSIENMLTQEKTVGPRLEKLCHSNDGLTGPCRLRRAES